MIVLRSRSRQRSPLVARTIFRAGGSNFRSLPGGVVAGPQVHASFQRGPDTLLLSAARGDPGVSGAPAELSGQVRPFRHQIYVWRYIAVAIIF